MLSWMRWLTSWFWSIFNSGGTSGGFLGWFTAHWVSLAVFLIIAGAIVDWLIWMIRWRPYWLWLRKRQIIYEEVPVTRRKRTERPKEAIRPDPAPVQDDYDDPFAVARDNDPYAEQAASPYARPRSEQDDLAEWDSTDDPYARQDNQHTDYDPRIYGRPVLGDQSRDGSARRTRPVFGERMKNTNVDDGQ